jgi:hypothetical protein
MVQRIFLRFVTQKTFTLHMTEGVRICITSQCESVTQIIQNKLKMRLFSLCITNHHLTSHNSKKSVIQCCFSMKTVLQIVPPQNVRSNVRFKLTLSILLCLKHLCAELKTNILSVKNYKYVRFPIFLTGMWKVTAKKNFRETDRLFVLKMNTILKKRMIENVRGDKKE